MSVMALCVLVTMMSCWIAGPGHGQRKDFVVQMKNGEMNSGKGHGQEERMKTAGPL